MNRILSFVSAFLLLMGGNFAFAQKLTSNIPYVESGHKRQALDVYTPESVKGKNLPVMFWIHGGGWQVGDKGDVGLKPKVLCERGFVFVSTNYRLLPEVTMEELTGDVAKSLGWVRRWRAGLRLPGSWPALPMCAAWGPSGLSNYTTVST